MATKNVSRLLVLIAAYVFVLIPIYSLGAALEGGARHLWPLTIQSLIYQGSAFLGQTLMFIIPAGVIAIPVLVWTIGRYITRRVTIGMLIATIVVMLVLTVTTIPFVFTALLGFPVALAVASAAYAFILLRTLHRNGIAAPAT